MTQTLSKGLFPQLTDVLQALANSQEMLLFKIQNMRLEQLNSVSLELGESANDEYPDAPDVSPPALRDTEPQATSDSDAPFLIGESDATRPDLISVASALSDPQLLADPKSTSLKATDHLTPTQEPSARQMVAGGGHAHVGERAEMSTRYESGHSETIGAEPAGPNNNFFDELDARLARLKHAEADSSEF